MAVVIVLPTREGSIHAEEDHPSPCVLNPAAAWVRNVPLPTLVAYRENVFPGEVHRFLPFERPEHWVTCDSIGLFLETECEFPFESEEDCYRNHGEREFISSYRRRGCSPTRPFVKNASAELIELYRRFLLPELADPKLRLACSPENRDQWIVPSHFDAFLESQTLNR